MQDRGLKFAREFILALAGLSLLIVALASFVFYLYWVSQPSLQSPSIPPNSAISFAAAKDFASLQLACESLAWLHDSTVALSRAQSLMLERIIVQLDGSQLVGGLFAGSLAFMSTAYCGDFRVEVTGKCHKPTPNPAP